MGWILIGFGILIILLFLFAAFVGISLTLGMRNKDQAKYDPLTKQWYPYVELTEEQQSRIIPGKNRLSKKPIVKIKVKDNRKYEKSKNVGSFGGRHRWLHIRILQHEVDEF